MGRVLLAALLAAAPSPGPAEGTPGMAGEASLIETVLFRRGFVRAHPHEEALALVTEASGGSLGAVAVFTRGPAVWARSSLDEVRLAGVDPSDLAHPDRIRRSLAKARPILFERERETPSLDALAARLIDSGIPACLAGAGHDGRSLRFYWNDASYAYRPGNGCRREPGAVEPLTGIATLRIPKGGLVDCLLFCAAYRRRFPSERATLVCPPGARPGEAFTTGAAYTRSGFLGIHTLRGANIEFRGGGLGAASIGDTALLVKLCAQGNARDRLNPEPPAEPADGGYSLAIAAARLSEAGIEAEVNATVKGTSGAPERAAARLVCNAQGVQFGYTPARGGYFKGAAHDRVRTSLLDALLFRGEYLREHPAERVVVLVHPPSSVALERKVVADTYFSRGGTVWLHSALSGDFELSGLPPSAMDDPGRLKASSTPGFLARVAAARARGPGSRAKAFQEPGIDEVASRLREAGVTAEVVAYRPITEAGERAAIAEDRVRFLWEGAAYTYGDNSCFACGQADGPGF